MSALIEALFGILLEGIVDNTLLADMEGDGAMAGEVLLTVIATLLAAAFGGLISLIVFAGYQWLSDKCK